jgi:hypothetical protein
MAWRRAAPPPGGVAQKPSGVTEKRSGVAELLLLVFRVFHAFFGLLMLVREQVNPILR